MKKVSILLLLIITQLTFSQTKSEIDKITKNYNKTLLNNLSNKLEKKYNKDKQEVLKLAKINNWKTFISDGNIFAELQRVVNGHPIYYATNNTNAGKSTRAVNLHSGGSLGLNIEGQNMTVNVWDGGQARATHQEFMVGGSSKISNGDGSTSSSYHATHVCGTIGAIGVNANAKGMAPSVELESFDWNNDFSEMTTAAANGLLISNHSYGAIANSLPDWIFGAYTTASKNIDEIMYNAPHYLIVTAAGNEGRDVNYNDSPIENNSQFDQLTFNECAKNSMVIGAAKDLAVNYNGDVIANYQVTSFSNAGPTDDYRIKPDILGNGEEVFSCTNGSDGTYASENGTSMASPSVAGSLILLQQLYNQEKGNFALSSTIKGLALHHADDGGLIGPDATYGWGYLNTKKCAEHLLNANYILDEKTLNNNETISYTVHALGGGKTLKASISWTDPASPNINNGFTNLNNPVLVNDIDIRVTKNGTTYFPWKLTSVNTNDKDDNSVDPFELVEIPYASGTYTITITHKGNLTNSSQNISILVSGINSHSLSINSNELATSMIWPNPAKNLLNINLNNTEITHISLTNILGQRIYQNTFKKDININTSNFDKGFYLLTLSNKNSKYTKKIIIN